MKNKMIIFVGMIILIVASAGCQIINMETKKENSARIQLQTDNTEKKNSRVSDFSKSDLEAMFKDVNDEAVLNFFYDDYNKDGVHEAYVLTEDKLWYISCSGCEIVLEKLQHVDAFESKILSFVTKDYLLLQYEDNLNNTRVYSIDNKNKVMEADVSDRGVISVDKDGEITLKVRISNQKDSAKPEEWGTYYIYYQIEEGFREYGAIPICEEQFLEYEGAENILDKIYQEYKGREVSVAFLYRANHIIHINISVADKQKKMYYNLPVQYGIKEVKPVSDKIYKGKAEAAYMVNIATFPTSFKHPVKSVAE